MHSTGKTQRWVATKTTLYQTLPLPLYRSTAIAAATATTTAYANHTLTVTLRLTVTLTQRNIKKKTACESVQAVSRQALIAPRSQTIFGIGEISIVSKLRNTNATANTTADVNLDAGADTNAMFSGIYLMRVSTGRRCRRSSLPAAHGKTLRQRRWCRRRWGRKRLGRTRGRKKARRR